AGLDAEAEERAGVVHLERGLAAVVALLRTLPFEDRGGVAEELLRERGGVVALGGVEAGLDGEGVGAEAGARAAPATPVAAPARGGRGPAARRRPGGARRRRRGRGGGRGGGRRSRRRPSLRRRARS